MDQIDLHGLAPIVFLGVGGQALGGGFGGEESNPGESSAHVGAEAGVGRRDGSPTEQVEGILPPLAVVPGRKRKFEQRSSASTAHARATRSNMILKRKNAALAATVDEQSETMKAITTMLPGVGKLLGHERVQQIGRHRTLSPKHFVLLCRAAHLPANSEVAIGIKHKRVILAATRLLLSRQADALSRLLERSAQALACGGGPLANQRRIHLSYSHLWDETQVRQKRLQDRKCRDNQMSMLAQTIVQRGMVRVLLLDGLAERMNTFSEAWLATPMQVDGTSAECLYPAIAHAMPSPLNLTNEANLAALAGSVSSTTVMPLCDRASGNMKILRFWAKQAKTSVRQVAGNKVLFWPDSCIVHLSARGKLVLRDLRHHTMRHFSIANLSRLHEVRTRMVSNMERLVVRKLGGRVVGPPPTNVCGLSDFVDVIFDMAGAFHSRGSDGSRRSQQWNDLKALCDMVNGEVRSGAASFKHHCWDVASRQPCCKSKAHSAEKAVVACLNAMLGQADPIPAESRWTHLLANMQKTLLRAVVCRIGLESFDAPELANEDENIDVDADALGGSFEVARRVRARRTAEYYNDRANTHQLAVFVPLVQCYDSLLLYTMLGDQVRGVGQSLQDECKLDQLLHEKTSVIGRCSAQLLEMARTWRNGDPKRKPWCVLDMLDVPVQDTMFMRWARSQVLLLATTVFRKFETKYASLPFSLYALCHDRSSEEKKRTIAEGLLAADPGELDPYSDGIRTLFPTIDALLSAGCCATLRADFTSHSVSTDLIERLHSEINHSIPKRAPARSFPNLARESLLKQAAVLHVGKGGDHPLGGRRTAKAPAVERLAVPPLLSVPCDLGEDPAGASRREEPSQRPLQDVATSSTARSSRDLVAPSMDAARQASMVAIGDFTEGSLVERPFTDTLAPRTATTSPSGGERKGLSPFLLERNVQVHIAREAKGCPLTPTEINKVHSDFKRFWDSLPDHTLYIQAYKDWQQGQRREQDTIQRTYHTSWGGGSMAAPISSSEFFAYHQRFGWPTDAEVFDPKAGRPPEDSEARAHDWDDLADVNLISIGARPHNVFRPKLHSREQFEMVERGLTNVIFGMTKGLVEKGDVLAVVSGCRLDDNSQFHIAFVITGICRSPKVFEVARCRFENSGQESSPELQLPARCQIGTRSSRISPSFECFDLLTSDELVLYLTQTFTSMRLALATYFVPDPDGTLLWSEITSLSDQGCLWEDGLKAPLGAAEARARRNQNFVKTAFGKLRTDDPLSTSARPPPRGRAQASTRPPTRQRGNKRSGAQEGEHPREPLQLALDETGDGTNAIPQEHIGNEGAADLGLGEHRSEAAEGAANDWTEEALGLEDALAEVIFEDKTDEFGDMDIDVTPSSASMQPSGPNEAPAVVGEGVDISVCAEIVGALSEAVEIVGLLPSGEETGSAEDDPGEGAPSGSGASSSSRPWDRLTAPSPVAGYVCDETGRSVMRIQRDKPQGRCTITCFKHARCSLLLNMSRTPPDSDLFKWLFEVEAPPPGATKEDKKELASRHIALGKARWSAPLSGRR